LGGRNQEFALAAAALIQTLGRVAVLASAGTDGVDGPTDAAGAIVDSTTLSRAQQRGLDWQSTLARNDAYHFFEPLGDLLHWGPTGTNVGDVQVLLVAPATTDA
jgi:hydroxypyruvate reductase